MATPQEIYAAQLRAIALRNDQARAAQLKALALQNARARAAQLKAIALQNARARAAQLKAMGAGMGAWDYPIPSWGPMAYQDFAHFSGAIDATGALGPTGSGCLYPDQFNDYFNQFMNYGSFPLSVPTAAQEGLNPNKPVDLVTFWNAVSSAPLKTADGKTIQLTPVSASYPRGNCAAGVTPPPAGMTTPTSQAPTNPVTSSAVPPSIQTPASSAVPRMRPTMPSFQASVPTAPLPPSSAPTGTTAPASGTVSSFFSNYFGSGCSESLINGVCDGYLYAGAAAIAAYLLMGQSGRRR